MIEGSICLKALIISKYTSSIPPIEQDFDRRGKDYSIDFWVGYSQLSGTVPLGSLPYVASSDREQEVYLKILLKYPQIIIYPLLDLLLGEFDEKIEVNC